jgi:hypothetical protein
MARRNIEHLSRSVSSTEGNEGRKVFQLIGFPNEKGDYTSNVVRCVPKSIAKAMRHYGTFTDDEIRVINALSVGAYKNWGAEKCMVVRIA